MILFIVIASVFVYLIIVAASKAFFRVYWFPGENGYTNWDELSKDGSAYFCAAFWPISFILFGIKKLAELVEKDIKKEQP